MPASYHTHTPLCHHATGEPEEFVRAAISAKISEYGISDHAPELIEPFDDWRMAQADLPRYFEWIERARVEAKSLAEKSGHELPIRCGLECDWLPNCQAWVAELSHKYSWDYLIGSVHYLENRWDFDNPKWLGKWADLDLEKVWENYWNSYAEMAKSRIFDILGHPDLIKKFAFRPLGNLDRFYIPTVEAIAQSGCAIELNTAGWHKPCSEQYPASRFLELAAEAKIPIVISSDAHAPEEIARDFPRAIELARASGFVETALFNKRVRSFEAL